MQEEDLQVSARARSAASESTVPVGFDGDAMISLLKPRRERRTGYEPFDLHAPIPWAVKG